MVGLRSREIVVKNAATALGLLFRGRVFGGDEYRSILLGFVEEDRKLLERDPNLAETASFVTLRLVRQLVTLPE